MNPLATTTQGTTSWQFGADSVFTGGIEIKKQRHTPVLVYTIETVCEPESIEEEFEVISVTPKIQEKMDTLMHKLNAKIYA